MFVYIFFNHKLLKYCQMAVQTAQFFILIIFLTSSRIQRDVLWASVQTKVVTVFARYVSCNAKQELFWWSDFCSHVGVAVYLSGTVTSCIHVFAVSCQDLTLQGQVQDLVFKAKTKAKTFRLITNVNCYTSICWSLAKISNIFIN